MVTARPSADATGSQARRNGPAVEEDGARTAGALPAAVLRPRQREILAEDGEQAPGGLHVEDVRLAVDLDRNGHPASSTGLEKGSSTI